MENFYYLVFESDYKELTWWAMSIRGILFLILGILLIKIGGKRIFGRQGALDIVISITLGALLAKAIAGNSKVIPTGITCIIMVLFHSLLSKLSFYNHFFEIFFKGKSDVIIKDGKYDSKKLKKYNVTNSDLFEVLRNKNHRIKMDDIEEAFVEANGKISIILKEKR